MSRGNSAGGLQQQVSIRTAPDLLKTKPTQEQHDTEEGGRMTLSLPRVPAGASIRSVLFDSFDFVFMEICLQFHRLYDTSHNTSSKTLADAPKPCTAQTTVVLNVLILELLHIEQIISCKCGCVFPRAVLKFLDKRMRRVRHSFTSFTFLLCPAVTIQPNCFLPFTYNLACLSTCITGIEFPSSNTSTALLFGRYNIMIRL